MGNSFFRDEFMRPKYIFSENDKVTDDEICSLRSSVGWDNNCYPFSITKDRSFVHFTIRHDQRLIGFLDVVSDGFNDAYIRDFMISKDHQKQGLGTELMNYALKYLKKKQIKCIQVIFHPKLSGYYKQFGFMIIGAGIIDKDDPNCENVHLP